MLQLIFYIYSFFIISLLAFLLLHHIIPCVDRRHHTLSHHLPLLISFIFVHSTMLSTHCTVFCLLIYLFIYFFNVLLYVHFMTSSILMVFFCSLLFFVFVFLNSSKLNILFQAFLYTIFSHYVQLQPSMH